MRARARHESAETDGWMHTYTGTEEIENEAEAGQCSRHVRHGATKGAVLDFHCRGAVEGRAFVR